MAKITKTISFKNKKAYFNYEFIDKYEAGIVLLGTEIKSVRAGRIDFTDSYCLFQAGELWLVGVHIAEYVLGTCNNHDPKRDRKLLLKKIELARLNKKVKEKGLTIVPTMLFINENGIAKVEIALARGKRTHDKRDSIQKRDNKRDLDRYNKHN